MNKRSKKKIIWTAVIMLALVNLSCQALFPRNAQPGSLEAQVAEGNIRFEGSGNVTYIGCQDPTAVVTVSIGARTRNIDGVDFNVDVNPVSITAITNGSQVKTDKCEKVDTDSQYNWPAKGIYYPNETRILFTTCTQNNDKASGEAFLVGEGFEGQYTCRDSDGGLMYEVAISAYTIIP